MLLALRCKDGTTHTFKLHRIVATIFIPNHDETHEVNHMNGDKNNNSVNNLEWISHEDNIKHAISNNLVKLKFGSDNGMAILDEKTVDSICKLLIEHNGSVSMVDKIINDKRITKSMIYDIKRGKTWRRVSEKYFNKDTFKTNVV